jgi:hypothetical protein|tara:strand:- start:101 stop:322 length:222 start_codon:yes stop_codon:yes gene_type:complete
MKNIKNITLSIFAIIGFVAILSSFNNQPQPQLNNYTIVSASTDGYPAAYVLNQRTGKIRFLRADEQFEMQPPK